MGTLLGSSSLGDSWEVLPLLTQDANHLEYVASMEAEGAEPQWTRLEGVFWPGLDRTHGLVARTSSRMPSLCSRGARSVVSPSKIGKPQASPHWENREHFLSLIPLLGVAVF